jgi:hypothetical protein
MRQGTFGKLTCFHGNQMPINSNHMGLFGIQQKPSLSALLDVVCLNHTKGCGFTEFTGVHYDHQTPLRPAENSFLEVTQ